MRKVIFSPNSVSSVAKISACDIDVGSIAIARSNAESNGVGEVIEFAVGTITEETSRFDFVCANLTLDILPILPLLVKKANNALVLSGILVEQKPEIISALENLEIDQFKIEKAGEWKSVVVTL